MKFMHSNNTVFVSKGGTEWQAGLPTMLMLHGAGMDHTVWVLLGRYFARHGYNLVIPDLPAHGASAGNVLTSIEAQSEWLNGLLTALAADDAALSLDDCVYCGHSMGSLLALQAAADASHKVSKLLLLGSAMPMAVGPPLLEAARDNSHAAIDMITLFGHSFGSQLGNNPISGINVFNAAEALLEQAADGVLYADLAACNDYDATTAAASVRDSIDVTLVAGREDRMTPLKAARQLQSATAASLQVIEDCGHMMMSEQPEATLLAFKHTLG